MEKYYRIHKIDKADWNLFEQKKESQYDTMLLFLFNIRRIETQRLSLKYLHNWGHK